MTTPDSARPAAEAAETRPAAAAMIRSELRLGLLLSIGVCGGLALLAATTEIAGAVIAPGQLAVDSSVKKVQHQTGGVVSEIRVREGARVKAGDLLARLDETVVSANLAIVVKSLDELAARQARLTAERDGLAAVRFPDDLVRRASDPEVALLLEGERNLFALRRAARDGQKGQLSQRLDQLQQEIQGLTGQGAAKTRELELINRELQGVRDLYKRNLIQLPRLTALEREETRLSGERGSLAASVAQARGKLSEIELQILQIDQDLRSEVARELREIQAKRAELVERRVAGEDQLRRVDIRAPQDGIVHQLAIHTVGGVVAPGETMMLIVPEGDVLVIDVKVAPQDIDQIAIDQPTQLRFSAFNQRTTPELQGRVSMVSADLTTDQRSGASYYTARVAVPTAEMDKLRHLRMLPGMPVEAFIQTGLRTVLSYLTKPLTDHLNKAFRQS